MTEITITSICWCFGVGILTLPLAGPTAFERGSKEVYHIMLTFLVKLYLFLVKTLLMMGLPERLSSLLRTWTNFGPPRTSASLDPRDNCLWLGAGHGDRNGEVVYEGGRVWQLLAIRKKNTSKLRTDSPVLVTFNPVHQSGQINTWFVFP